MGSKDSGKVPVVDYSLSVHFAICHGPIDYVHRIVVKEKEAWRGKVSGNTRISVNKRDLFGGNKKEGGVAGIAHLLPGDDDQVIPAYIAARFGRTPATMPAYRGVASMFFSDGSTVFNAKPSYAFSDMPLDRKGGFYWGSNNPYLPETWIKVSRMPKTPLPSGLVQIENLIPEAIIGLPEEEEQEDDDESTPVAPDAEAEDPLNGYYIGELPTEEQFIKTTFGYRGTQDSLDNDPTFVRRIFDVDNQDKLKIGGCVYRDYGNDANPAHILCEYLLNAKWGMGTDETALDMESFRRAAQTLFDERFGLTIQWNEQTTIEDMVSEVLDHIQGMIYLDPGTGLLTLSLIRNDYVFEDLVELNPENAAFGSFQRKAWGETINEVVVTWTNPENEKESTVTLQDLGNIAVQGAIVSDGRNYHGIRNPRLAMQVCARDLRTASAPLASIEAEVSREFWTIRPGQCVRVRWPERQMEQVVFRVLKVDYGKIGSPGIKLSMTEDIFSLPTQGYVLGATVKPGQADNMPEPLDYLTFLSLPYQLLARFGLDATRTYPDVGVIALGASDNGSIEDFLLSTPAVLPTGEATIEDTGKPGVTSHFKLAAPLALEFTSTIPIFSALTRSGGDPEPGGLVVLGATDGGHEIGVIQGFDENDGWIIQRGMLDTIPRAWPAGTGGWIVDFDVISALDNRIRTAGVPIDYRIRPATATQMLDEEDYQPGHFTPSERPYCPTRPANVMIEGERVKKTYTTAPPASIVASWSNRNRLMEDSVFPVWTAGNVSPEVGQTTTIRLYDEAGTLSHTYAGITGTTFGIPGADLTGGAQAVRFFAVRDGYESIQAYEVVLETPGGEGYGQAYGENYGG